MKSHLVAIPALLLVACVSDSAQQQDDDRRCPYATEDFTEYELFQTLANSQRGCLVGDVGAAIGRMTAAETQEDLRTIFLGVCAGAPEFRRCLAGIAEDGRLCLATSARKMFENVGDYIEAAVGAACSNRSVGVSALMHTMTRLDNESMAEAEGCIAALEATRITNVTDFTAEFSRTRYQTVRNIKECIVGVIQAENDPDPGDNIGGFFDEILARMTCISFETREVELCESTDIEV